MSPRAAESQPQACAAAVGEPAFVVFSDDWGEHPSSSQHLFRVIGARCRVLWVNTIGMRNPTLSVSDLRKIRKKLSKMLQGRHPGKDTYATRGAGSSGLDVHVRQPFMLPFSGLAPVRGINRRSVMSAVKRAAAELGIVSPVVVSSVPNACDFVGDLGARRIVYYCVDDFAQWPGLQHGLVRRMEERLIARSDVLVATSHNLYERLGMSGKRTYLLTHGVDLELFAQEAPEEHPCLAGIPKPRAGYFGLFDERSDQDLIASLAARMPDFAFVFTGPVATSTARLKARPNVYFTGALPYAELPALIKGLDALFVPYLVNDFTASISPLKLKEYLVTGKPVVTTPMAEALLQRAHLAAASTPDEWVAALRSALSADVARRRHLMMQAMTTESWTNKARRFLEICSNDDLGGHGVAA